MIYKRVFMLGITLLLAQSCNAKSDNIWFDASTYKAVIRKQTASESHLPTVMFANGTEVSSCDEFLAQSKTGPLASSVNNHIHASAYLICSAREAFKEGGASYNLANTQQEQSIANTLCNSVSLSSFPSSLAQLTDESHDTLRSLFNGDAKATGNSCDYKKDDRNFVLTAVAEFGKNAQTRTLLVFVTDEILDGNYRSYKAIRLFKNKSGKAWSAKP